MESHHSLRVNSVCAEIHTIANIMGPYATAFRWSHSISISVCLTRKKLYHKITCAENRIDPNRKAACLWNAWVNLKEQFTQNANPNPYTVYIHIHILIILNASVFLTISNVFFFNNFHENIIYIVLMFLKIQVIWSHNFVWQIDQNLCNCSLIIKQRYRMDLEDNIVNFMLYFQKH